VLTVSLLKSSKENKLLKQFNHPESTRKMLLDVSYIKKTILKGKHVVIDIRSSGNDEMELLMLR
jgi:hypothetical protein